VPRYRPRIIAHRGDSAHAPENTLTAFRLALEGGADALETDLWLTRDERVVLFHDPTAERLTGNPCRIADMRLSEVRSLTVRADRGPVRSGDNGPADEGVPTLDELLAMTPPGVLLVLELKDPRFAEPRHGRALIQAILPRVATRTAVVVSFSMALLRALKTVCPAVPVGHITLRQPLPLQRAELLGPYWPLLVVNPWYVRMAHRRGRLVAPLDPDLHRRLPRYMRLGVDAVLTSDPAATLALVQRLAGGPTTPRPLLGWGSGRRGGARGSAHG